MKAYASDQLRNVVLMGHGGSGKTSLAEAMLFVSGAISRMGKVEDRNTVSDFDEQEHQHHYSISTSLVAVEWANARVNVLDTPGYPDFEGEAVAAATAADAAIITVDAVAGVQSGTEVAWDARRPGRHPPALLRHHAARPRKRRLRCRPHRTAGALRYARRPPRNSHRRCGRLRGRRRPRQQEGASRHRRRRG